MRKGHCDVQSDKESFGKVTKTAGVTKQRAKKARRLLGQESVVQKNLSDVQSDKESREKVIKTAGVSKQRAEKARRL